MDGQKGVSKMRIVKLFFVLFFLNVNLEAAFENWNYSVRPIALNGAFTGISDDVNSLLYNPAGIALLKETEISSSYSKPYAGISGIDFNTGSILIGFPAYQGLNVGLGFTSFLDSNQVYYYRENQIILNIAGNFENLISNFDLYSGINFKVLSLCGFEKGWMEGGDPLLKKTDWQKINADLGLLLDYKQLRFGVKGENLIPQNLGILEKDKLPAALNFGISWQKEIFNNQKIISTVELTKRENLVRQVLAFEYQYLDLGAIQIGFAEDNLSAGFSLLLSEIIGEKTNNYYPGRIDMSCLYSPFNQGFSPHISLLWRFK